MDSSLNFFLKIFLKNNYQIITLRFIRLHKNSFLETDQLESAIRNLLPINNFSELRIPLKVVATNLNDGQDVVYDKGDLIGPFNSKLFHSWNFSSIL